MPIKFCICFGENRATDRDLIQYYYGKLRLDILCTFLGPPVRLEMNLDRNDTERIDGNLLADMLTVYL